MMPPDFSGVARLAYVGVIAVMLAVPAVVVGLIVLIVWLCRHVHFG